MKKIISRYILNIFLTYALLGFCHSSVAGSLVLSGGTDKLIVDPVINIQASYFSGLSTHINSKSNNNLSTMELKYFFYEGKNFDFYVNSEQYKTGGLEVARVFSAENAGNWRLDLIEHNITSTTLGLGTHAYFHKGEIFSPYALLGINYMSHKVDEVDIKVSGINTGYVSKVDIDNIQYVYGLGVDIKLFDHLNIGIFVGSGTYEGNTSLVCKNCISPITGPTESSFNMRESGKVYFRYYF